MAKPYSNYTLSDIYRLNMSFLKKDRTPDEVAHSASLMAYLVERCNQINCTVILEENFLDHFDRDTFHTLTKQDINKKLSELVAKQQSIFEASIGDQAKILEYYKQSAEFKANNVEILSKDIANLSKNITSQMSEYDSYVRALHDISESLLAKNINLSKLELEYEEALNNPTKYDIKLVKAIEDVLATNKFWYIGTFTSTKPFRYMAVEKGAVRQPSGTFTPATGKSVHGFITTEDVIVKHVDQLANVDLSYNCGKAFIAVSGIGTPVYVRFIANVADNYSSHPHPHVSSSGSICWGNALDRVNKQSSVDGIASMKNNMLTLMALLTTYTPDNPYVKMADLVKRNYTRVDNALICTANLYEQFTRSACKYAQESASLISESMKTQVEATKIYQKAIDENRTWTRFCNEHTPLENHIITSAHAFHEAYYSNKHEIRQHPSDLPDGAVVMQKLNIGALEKFKLHPMIYHYRLLNISLKAGDASDSKVNRDKAISYIAQYLPIGSKIIYFSNNKIDTIHMGTIVRQEYTGNSESTEQAWILDNGEKVYYRELAMILELGNISPYPFNDFGVQPAPAEWEEADYNDEDYEEIEEEEQDEEQEETDDEYYDEEQNSNEIPF